MPVTDADLTAMLARLHWVASRDPVRAPVWVWAAISARLDSRPLSADDRRRLEDVLAQIVPKPSVEEELAVLAEEEEENVGAR